VAVTLPKPSYPRLQDLPHAPGANDGLLSFSGVSHLDLQEPVGRFVALDEMWAEPGRIVVTFHVPTRLIAHGQRLGVRLDRRPH